MQLQCKGQHVHCIQSLNMCHPSNPLDAGPKQLAGRRYGRDRLMEMADHDTMQSAAGGIARYRMLPRLLEGTTTTRRKGPLSVVIMEQQKCLNGTRMQQQYVSHNATLTHEFMRHTGSRYTTRVKIIKVDTATSEKSTDSVMTFCFGIP